MAAATEHKPGNVPPSSNHHEPISPSRVVPVSDQPNSASTPTIQTSAPSPGDPMEVTTAQKTDAPSPSPSQSQKEHGNNNHGANGNSSSESARNDMSPAAHPSANSGSMPAPPTAAAAAVHQPKIVQTAFIHKLYNMLEDTSIQHLISWSQSADSFIMSPSPDFSKVLAQYFKHTNISSFVRQLNMYGFHKVSDAFNTGSPEVATWEFKHGNGNFKRGDLIGLREIKRRASRHALVHRDYPNTKTSSSQPGTPSEPMPPPPNDGGDPRMGGLEHNLYDISMRLQRNEDNAHYMHIKQQALTDTLGRLLHFNQELSRSVLNLVPGPEHPVYRDVVNLQNEMQRQADVIRSLDEPHDPSYPTSRSYFANLDHGPVSPRQVAQDDARRNNNLTVPSARGPGNFHRPAVPSGLGASSRRGYGSIGSSTAPQSPSPLRVPQPPPPGPHPLSQVEAPGSLARRHTSADIRDSGWQGNQSYVPSGPPSGPWPSSPGRAPPGAEDQRIRDSLSSYSLQTASQPRPGSRPTTPPPPSHFPNGNGGGSDSFGNWNWSSASRGSLAVKDNSMPPTRRGSMAHILNPTETAERDDEDDDLRGDDDRKRKRMQ